MQYTSQADVDAAFADLDGILAEREAPRLRLNCCQYCGCSSLARVGNDGARQDYYSCCDNCGAVQTSGYGQSSAVYWDKRGPISNYRRIHHWHERISQLCLLESPIPDDEFARIAERLLDGSHTVLNKDVIRGVLRSLNMQLYIEKWLSIIFRLTGIEPARPGPVLLLQLDSMFQDLQRPFDAHRNAGRKNFLNYNYCFARLFQKLECTQFSMFFPLIKSRQKLRALDEMWGKMAESLGWEVTVLQQVAPFAVRLEQPEALLQRLRQPGVARVPVAMHTEPWRTGFRKSDLRLIRELDLQRARAKHRSNPPEPPLQIPVSSKKRPRPASATVLQWKPRLLPLRRLV
tara:strand:- start:5017 stop:6054 length:1038 start_codon:yes stop_codon:yes gene_type:complete